MREHDMAVERPERIKQKTIAPLKTDGEIRAEKAVCRFDYYMKDSRGKWLPRLYLCEHRTLADIFLESALFDPKKNVLCIPGVEWESTPEEARKSLKNFEKIFREPGQASLKAIRRLFRAREAGKSILLPVTGDARGMDREPFLDANALVKLCRSLEMPVCTVTFRGERAAAPATDRDPKKAAKAGGFPETEKTAASDAFTATDRAGGRHLFFLDVRPLFLTEDLKRIPEREAEAAIRNAFQIEEDPQTAEDFRERKRLRMREFLRSDLRVEIPVDICQINGGKEEKLNQNRSEEVQERRKIGVKNQGKKNNDGENADENYEERRDPEGILRVDMTGITLETAGRSLHRGPGALRSLAVYPGKDAQTGERGTVLVYPYFETVFYLFTAQKEGALDIQAAVEQMYEIVSEQ